MNAPRLPPILVAGALALAAPADVVADERLVPLSRSESLRVTEEGRGQAVVLIPGLFGSAFGFRHVVSRLEREGYRVVVVEPLGVGGSSRPDDADYSLTAQADRIARAMEALGAERAVVVAHSVGASMALRLSYRHPHCVAAIVSLDGGPAEAAATPGFQRAMRFAPLLRLFGGMRRVRGIVRKTLVARSADPRWVTEDVVDGYMAASSRDLGATLAAYKGMARAREPEELRDHLGEVRCPVRLVLGDAPHEGGPSGAEIRLLRDRLPSFAVDVIPGVGHFAFEEDPDAVVAAVDRAAASARPRAAASR